MTIIEKQKLGLKLKHIHVQIYIYIYIYYIQEQQHQRYKSPGIVRRRIGRSRWIWRRRIASRRVTLSLIGWRLAIGLSICWLGCISNWWRSCLIETWHMLDCWYCHWLWSKLAISFIHFNLVLRLNYKQTIITMSLKPYTCICEASWSEYEVYRQYGLNVFYFLLHTCIHAQTLQKEIKSKYQYKIYSFHVPWLKELTRVHYKALRAINHIRQTVQQLRRLLKFIASN